MANLSTENLFLLEFLVEELDMKSRCDCGGAGEVCVSFQFLDNEAMDVCEGDFSDNNKFNESESKTGKSCLFSLTPAQAQRVLKAFDITVNVVKKMPEGWEPRQSVVGSTIISLLPIFIELITYKDAEAQAKVLQETYPILDSNGANVGKIGVFIRLSCYGKMIITQFQMNMDDKSVLFKDKDGRSLYRYKKSKRGKTTKIEDMTSRVQNRPCPPCLPPQQPSQGMYGQFPQFGQSFAPPMSQMNYPPPNLNCPMQPCFPPDFGQFNQQPPQQNFGRPQAKSACSGRCSRY